MQSAALNSQSADYNGINHYRDEQVQPVNRDRSGTGCRCRLRKTLLTTARKSFRSCYRSPSRRVAEPRNRVANSWHTSLSLFTFNETRISLFFVRLILISDSIASYNPVVTEQRVQLAVVFALTLGSFGSMITFFSPPSNILL